MIIKKVTRNSTVLCPRDGHYFHISKCKNCEDCFGIVENRKVLCKRGDVKQDEFLKKSGNIRGEENAKKIEDGAIYNFS